MTDTFPDDHLGARMTIRGFAIAGHLLCMLVAPTGCREARDSSSRRPEGSSSNQERAETKATPRALGDASSTGSSAMELSPREPLAAPASKNFDDMRRDGHIFLADARLRNALGPDFDARNRGGDGFCVELTRYDGYWSGYASDSCSHRMIPGASDSPYAGPKKTGLAWLFESPEASIRIVPNAVSLSVSLFDPTSHGWSRAVEVTPSESPQERTVRWHKDATQAFLEQASASDALFTEKERGHWKYKHQNLRNCSLYALRCQQGNLALACEYGRGEYLIIDHRDGRFAVEHLSGELLQGKCISGPFAGLRIRSP